MSDDDEVTAKIRRRANDHLIMVRAHLHSIQRTTKSASESQIHGQWLIVAARQAQLDIRMVVEEMMLLSVAAHEDSGQHISRTLRKEYRAGVIAKKLARLNQNFFPVAISVIPSDEPDVAGRFMNREGRHLTQEKAIDFWNRAGGHLHANSIVVANSDLSRMIDEAAEFLRLTVSLLETFEVDVSGQGMWIGGHLNFAESRGPEVFYAASNL
jgi:hypothetical protein